MVSCHIWRFYWCKMSAICSFIPKILLSAQSIETESLLHQTQSHFPLSVPSHHIPDQHLSLSFPLPQSDVLRRREEGGSSVYRSSHHLWNFRARPRWKGVLCPPDEECPCVAPQRKGFIWPGIWRHLEKCRGDFLGGGDGKLKAFIRLESRRTGLPKSQWYW